MLSPALHARPDAELLLEINRTSFRSERSDAGDETQCTSAQKRGVAFRLPGTFFASQLLFSISSGLIVFH